MFKTMALFAFLAASGIAYAEDAWMRDAFKKAPVADKSQKPSSAPAKSQAKVEEASSKADAAAAESKAKWPP